MDDKTSIEAPQLDEFLKVQEIADSFEVKPQPSVSGFQKDSGHTEDNLVFTTDGTHIGIPYVTNNDIFNINRFPGERGNFSHVKHYLKSINDSTCLNSNIEFIKIILFYHERIGREYSMEGSENGIPPIKRIISITENFNLIKPILFQ